MGKTSLPSVSDTHRHSDGGKAYPGKEGPMGGLDSMERGGDGQTERRQVEEWGGTEGISPKKDEMGSVLCVLCIAKDVLIPERGAKGTVVAKPLRKLQRKLNRGTLHMHELLWVATAAELESMVKKLQAVCGVKGRAEMVCSGAWKVRIVSTKTEISFQQIGKNVFRNLHLG